MELEPLPKLDNATAIYNLIAQVTQEVHSGKLDPKVAGSVAQLARLLLQALPATDLEKQGKDLELPDDFSLANISTPK